MIYASRQWFLVVCVMGLSLKLEKCWVRIKRSRRMKYVIWLHKQQKRQKTKVLQGYPHLCVSPPVACDAAGQTWYVPAALCQPERNGKVTAKTQVLLENRFCLCSQLNSSQVTYNSSTADSLGFCSHITNFCNHTILSPTSN